MLRNIEQNTAGETPSPLLLNAHERTKTHMFGDLQDRAEDVVVSKKRSREVCFHLLGSWCMTGEALQSRTHYQRRPAASNLSGLSNRYGLSLSREQKKCAQWHTL